MRSIFINRDIGSFYGISNFKIYKKIMRYERELVDIVIGDISIFLNLRKQNNMK